MFVKRLSGCCAAELSFDLSSCTVSSNMEYESDHAEEPIVIVSCTDSSGEWNDSVLPTTIFQILHAEHSSDQDAFFIDGRKIGLVSITAHVVSMEEGTINCKFSLEDGTGQITAFKPLLSVKKKQSPLKEQRERDTYNALVGSYIEATAKLRMFRRHIFLDLPAETQVHKVLDFHQVIFHALTAMHAHVSGSSDIPQPKDAPENPGELMGTMSGPHVSVHSVIESVRAPEDLDIEVQMHQLASLVLDKGKEDWEHTSVPIAATFILQAVQELSGFDNKLVSLADIQEGLHNCSEAEFVDAVYYLLNEAYLTSPLDDGYVIITPRD